MPHSLSPIEMISRLIEIPSVSSVMPDLDMGNLEVVELLANWLDELGYRIEMQHLKNRRDKANLIATLGDADEGLVLAGHTDTVPFDQQRWNFDPFRLTESENRLYGLGTSDMKSFLALAIAAAAPFKSHQLRRPLTIIATADEETTMDGAKLLSAQGKRLGRHCLIGEPTNLFPVHQHKGIFMEAIRLRGSSGHSSDPSLGNNALEGMHAVIQSLLDYRRELQAGQRNPAFDVPVPTLNLGHIHGGDNPNRICGECELHIDLRPLPGMDIPALRQELRKRVSSVAESLALQCEFKTLFSGVPAMETPADAHIVRLAEQLSGHHSGAVAFCTEGPYYNALGMETVILGPGDIAQAHQPDEYLAMNRIQPTLDLLKRIIHSVCIDPN
ncbi:MAG: acetylornithine deacetylase [Pseudomonadota bacterium]